MKSLYIIILFICAACLKAVAVPQPGETDSLKRLILTSNGQVKGNDTTTINRLTELAEDFYESYPDSAVLFAKMAIQSANKLNYIKGVAAGNILLGKVTSFQGDYAIANNYYNTSLKLYNQTNNQLGISEAYIGLGRVQDFLGNYKRAIQLFEQALAIRINLRSEIDIANCYAIIGITYDNKGDFSKAIDYYFKSLIIDLKLNKQLLAADNYCNIGVVMQHLELYQKALDYFNKANTLWLKLNDKQGISTCYQNIGEVMLALKQYSKAYDYFKKASALYQELGDEEGISLIYYNLGLYHYHTAKPDSAIYYLNMALKSAKKSNIMYNVACAYNGLAQIYNLEKDYNKAYKYALLNQQTANTLQSVNMQADAALQLSAALAGLKHFDEAYQQHLLYANLTDSLKSDESMQKLISYNLALAFENNQRMASVKETYLEKKLAMQRGANYIYATVIVVITIMLVIYYNAKRKQLKANALLKIKNEEILTQTVKLNELNVLKDRLISVLAHDLRAPLSTLRGMFSLMTEKDITYVEFITMAPNVFKKLEYTSDFLDTLLFWINSQVDNIEDTIKSFYLHDLVKKELDDLTDQFKAKNIKPISDVSEQHAVLADPNSIRIVIHNFLTNAIKFSHHNSTIKVSARLVNNVVEFSVTDYGIGMPQGQLDKLFKSKVTSQIGTGNELGTGMGLIFCKDLVEKYNGKIWATSILNQGTELSFSLAADNTYSSDNLYSNAPVHAT